MALKDRKPKLVKKDTLKKYSVQLHYVCLKYGKVPKNLVKAIKPSDKRPCGILKQADQAVKWQTELEVAKAKQRMDLPDNDMRSIDFGCSITDSVIDTYLFRKYGNIEGSTLLLTTMAFFNMQERMRERNVYSKCYWEIDNQFAKFEQILIPVHIDSLQHWILIRICDILKETCLVQVYDPLNAPGLFDEVDLIHRYFKRLIANSAFSDCTQEVDIQFRKDIPQQKKGSQDCGIYVIHYIEQLLLSHKAIPDFDVRKKRDNIKETLWYLQDGE